MCSRCGGDLESDDAISVIEGVCADCRRTRRFQEPSPPPQRDALADLLAALDAERQAVAAIRAKQTPKKTSPSPTSPPAADHRPPPRPVAPRPVPTQTYSSPPPRRQPYRDPQLPAPRAPQRPRQPVGAPAGNGARAPRPQRPRQPSPPITFVDSLPPPRVRHRRRDLLIGVAFGLLLTTGVTGYFLSTRLAVSEPLPLMAEVGETRDVTLTISPAWARVTLDGREVGPSDSNGQLTLQIPDDAEAVAWLEVTAPGYQPRKQPISALRGVNNVSIDLLRMPYQVAVRSDPPEAEVWVGHEMKGVTPVTLEMSPQEAETTLTLKRRGYADARRSVQPPPDGDHVEVAVELEPIGVVARVETDPPGAKVFVNGEAQGIAPLDVRLGEDLLGREVELSAALDGYTSVARRIRLPRQPGEPMFVPPLVLRQKETALVLDTNPPGGHVIADGVDLGVGPVRTSFRADQIGRPVLLEGLLPGTHYGRREFIVPSPGTSSRIVVPLAFQSQDVAFVVASPPNMQTDLLLLTDALADRIQRLRPEQRFSIVAHGYRGIDVWPGRGETVPATAEQRIRAYDALRSLRPGGAHDLDKLMNEALATDADTIWIFSAGAPNERVFRQFSRETEQRNLTVHVARTDLSEDDAWLRQWAAGFHGVVSLIGQRGHRSLAFDAIADPP